MTDFSKTIKLPSTQFSMKANLAETENNWIKFWKNNNLYKNLKEESNKFEKFILHDGPPYANGNLHMGHALNKILKDIVCRTKFQSSLDVNYVPGWDCHGLPIEWNIEEKFRKSGKKKNEIDLGVFRNECREFASLWVEKQKEQFSRLGIQSDWSNIYTTMTRSSEVSIVKELLKFLESGELYLGFKPVMWSVVEKTALAEAEVEYKEKISKSIFVKFPVQNMSEDLSIIIWTTTPWTIPCNRAIAYSQELKYKKILILSDYDQKNLKKNDKVIISENLIENFLSRHKIEKFSILDDVNEDELKKFICSHPLKKLGFNFEIRLYPSNHVTDETGSGFVHIAPNHGVEDFEVGLKFGLDNSETVDDGGIYSDNVPFFKGIHVYKADEEVIQQLGKFKNLLSDEDYNHSYPHSWRSKAPLIFRATSQWFISMEKNKLREKAIQEINDVKWIPASSKNRILSMVKERPDWCVSRQRSWGVPITIFISKKSNKPLIDKEVNAKIISKLNELGIDAWFEKPNDFFLTNKYRGEDFIKVDSILDVWFDSGSSHVFVLKDQGLTKKADLYLEGSDQHRGWFQTSLLESCAIYKESPYKSVLTHGFVIDDKGRKMSKSLGNIILPSDIIKKYGADILRMWVASSNFTEDLKISFESLNRLSDSYRKIRNTLRFVLGNMKDWDPSEKISHEDLPELEKYIRHRLYKTNNEVQKNYNEFNFHKTFQIILSFCSQDLSAFFFDIRKDSLYCDSINSYSRRSCRTVLKDIFQCLITWLAPIIPFTTEEAFQSWKSEINKTEKISCHLLKFLNLPKIWIEKTIENDWEKVFQIRDAFSYSMEKHRQKKDIKSGLEVKVYIFSKDESYKKVSKKIDLAETLIVSEIEFVEKKDKDFDVFPENEKISIKVGKIKGFKCPRCWKTFSSNKTKETCDRCDEVINESN